MTAHRSLAFALAGSFFLLVSCAFAIAVGVGWASYDDYDEEPYVSQEPLQQLYVAPAKGELRGPQPVSDHGQLVAWTGSEWAVMPELNTDYDVEVRGDLVAVRLTQRFENRGNVALDATYQFPLEEGAAVYGMKMRIGEEVVEAKIQKREQAKATFEAAKQAGQVAALTEQKRPNLFEQSVANIMPGAVVEVELRYTHALQREDGEYVLTLPLAVGEKFTPGDTAPNALQVPVSNPPRQDTEGRVGIDVRIDAGMPIRRLHSLTHEVDIETLGVGDARVQLKKGRVADDRDFELRFAIAQEDPSAGLLATYDEETGRGYFSLLIEPPAKVEDADVTPREMVFVLDCSGSMSGLPMAASKAFMRQALRRLRPTDTFRIIRFSEEASEYSSTPIPVTPANLADALEYVAELTHGGGTDMTAGISKALLPPVAPGTIRLVTFMTDGFVGNDYDVTRLLHDTVGDSRLFAIGVGTSTNRYLLDEMGRAGRGFTRYIDPTEDPETTAAEITAKLQSPVMTDIKVQIEDGADVNLNMDGRVADLFDRNAVRVSGTYENPGKVRLVVRGNTARGPISLPLEIELPEASADGEAVRLMWARDRIADHMHVYTTPRGLRELGELDLDIEASVTDLGLRHSLMTQWTSFVAVSTSVVNPGGDSADVHIGNATVAGTDFAGFGGGTTPEPGVIGGLLLMLFGGAASRRRRR